jgi:hypothetical protein
MSETLSKMRKQFYFIRGSASASTSNAGDCSGG